MKDLDDCSIDSVTSTKSTLSTSIEFLHQEQHRIQQKLNSLRRQGSSSSKSLVEVDHSVTDDLKNVNILVSMPQEIGGLDSTGTMEGDTTNSSGSPPSNHERKRVISFGSISIREYCRIPGDNPSVSHGPPISIEWDHQSEYSIDLDQYDSTKQTRSSVQMKMSGEQRIALLKNHGNSWMSIHSSIRAANLDRRKRLQTIREMEKFKISELFHSFKIAVTNAFTTRDSYDKPKKFTRSCKKVEPGIMAPGQYLENLNDAQTEQNDSDSSGQVLDDDKAIVTSSCCLPRKRWYKHSS